MKSKDNTCQVWICIFIICFPLLFAALCAYTDTIDTSLPRGIDDPREADDNMRRIQAGFQEILAVEHNVDLTGTVITGDGTHTDITADSLTLNTDGYITDVIAKGPWVDVRAYGAAGDGVTDDTTAIQAAIDYCNTNSLSPLYFPVGTYIINAPLVSTQNRFVIKGESMYRSKIQTGGSWSGTEMFDLNDANKSYITIKDLYFYGDGKLVTDAHGIRFAQTVKVTLRNVLLANLNRGLVVTDGTTLRLEGVYAANCYFGFHLTSVSSVAATNCVTELCNTGLLLSGISNSSFINHWFEQNVAYALYGASGCFNNTFTGGYLAHSGTQQTIFFDNNASNENNLFVNIEFAGTGEILNGATNPLYLIHCKSLPTVTGTYRTALDPYDLSSSGTWNPASIPDGDEEAANFAVTGAALGDFAMASFSLDVIDLVLDAQVTTSGIVTCVLANNTGGAIDLGSGTVYVRVMKK